ncbi:hypothetical protein O9992_22430 [Vibrio lentus]|nr:hypothetical protein [Vibrio lentus]
MARYRPLLLQTFLKRIHLRTAIVAEQNNRKNENADDDNEEEVVDASISMSFFRWLSY